jgi:hypothetical protein
VKSDFILKHLLSLFILGVAVFYPGLLKSQELCFPTSSEDLEITIECGEEIPPFAECSGSSPCCGDVSTESFESETGNISESCVLSTAFGPGPDWAFWLPDIDGNNVSWRFEENGFFEAYGDGTARIWGIIYKVSNPELRMEANLWLENGRTWEEWSALGRSYKDDLNLAGSEYINWSYYELVEGFSWLQGIGELSNTQLMLTHKPGNYYFGFQAGVAANCRNANEGLSGWFDYSGYYQGEWVTGHGDVNVDRTCSNIPDGCGSTTFSRICRVTNECQLSSFYTQDIHVLDTTPPAIISFESEVTEDCGNPVVLPPIAEDSCSEVIITYTDEVVVPGCGGEIIRTFLVSDACGNSVELIQVVSVTGNEPVFTSFPDDLATECSLIPPADNPQITFTPGCDNTVISVEETIIPGECSGSYTLLRIYTLTDDCGNAVSQTWTIEVSDTTPPQLFNVPADMTIICGEPVDDALPFAIDNCTQFPSIGLSASTEPLDCGYLFIRTWFVTDDCGNMTSASQTITVLDNTPPQFDQFPVDITVSCGNVPEAESTAPSASDACSSFTLEMTEVSLPGECPVVEIIQRTWTATDGCGNSVSETWTITVTDEQGPALFGVPEDQVLNCGEDVADAIVFATDDCTAEPVIGLSAVTNPLTCGEEFVRTWTAIDGCGNATTAVQVILFTDTEAPVFTLIPENLEIQCGEEIPLSEVAAGDNCSEVAVSMEEITGTGCAGGIERIYTATDGCGNSATVSQIITVIDNEPPFVTNFPGVITVSCDEVPDAQDVEIQFFDECSDFEVSTEEAIEEGFCPGQYQIIRTYTATDDCGNSTTAVLTIQVVDNDGPVFEGDFSDVQAECGVEVALPEFTVTDACSDISEINFSSELTETDCEITEVRVWTAVDGCGNISLITQTVTWLDTTDPVFQSLPENITIACGDPMPELVIPIAIDACAGVVETLFAEEFDTTECGGEIITRVFRAFDPCGNEVIYAQDITVVDNEAPVVSGPAVADVLCGAEDQIQITAFDACSNDITISWTDEETAEQYGCAGTFNRIYTVTDGCGNSTTFEQLTGVFDNDSPQILSFPEDGVFSCNEVPAELTDDMLFTDNCGDPLISVEVLESPGFCSNNYMLERIYTITDACGNQSQQTWVLEVIDDTPPVLIGVPDDISIGCNDPVPPAIVTALDNCSGTTDVGLTVNTVEDECGFIVTRTWFTQDECGNVSEATQIITGGDQSAPELSAYPEDVTIPCGDPLPPVPSISAFDSCIGELDVDFQEEVVGGIDCDEVYLRTWCATNCAGLTTCWTQTISFESSDNTFFSIASNTEQEVILEFSTPATGYTEMAVYNNAGQLIATPFSREATAGATQRVVVPTHQWTSGIYRFRLVQGDFVMNQALAKTK